MVLIVEIIYANAVIDRSLSITRNIFRIQAYDSIMCTYFFIGFVDSMLVGKTLTEFTNLISPNNFKRNDDIILNYFMNKIYKKLNAIPLSIVFMKHQICTQISVQIYQMINSLD